MTKEEHNCDNVNCNHNNTKGLCCLHNPDNCKYRQLQKENAELKVSCKIQVDTAFQTIYEKDNQLTKAKEIIRDFISVAIDYIDKEDKNYSYIVEAEQFLKDEPQSKWVNPARTTNDNQIKLSEVEK